MKTVFIPLADISIDGGTQARAEINAATVSEYAECMSEGETLPPALVFFDGAKHFLADGFHRFHANSKIGAVSMECEIRTGTLLDARLYSYGANKGHGLRRSNDDKRKAVLGMLADFADWSDVRIARHVGVSDKTVAAHRKPILGNSDDAPTARTVERNGKTYTQDTSGQKKAGKERAEKPADVAPKSPAPAAAQNPTAEEDEAPAPAAATPVGDPRDAQIKSLEAQIDSYRVALAEELNENTRIGTVLDADDKVAAAMAGSAPLAAENKNLRALLKTANERINGLMFEKQQMDAECKRLQRLVARMKKLEAA